MPEMTFSPYVRLVVDDLPANVRFFRDQVGLKLNSGNDQDVSDYPYVEFVAKDGTLALMTRHSLQELLPQADAPAHGFHDGTTFTAQVTDVDAAVAELSARGVVFVLPATDRPVWGLRTAHFRAPEGHLFELQHPLPPQE